ncbi:RCC1 domain-containing protein 1 isoform X2 [Bacillus rossius redtenbacheri]|uniref:RCC1 domain-containing protein 1 isoform X2 n=1 Tax=Bacillus rossius redtenbacheri TaxID=93214 RepID=UPI002FDD6F5D
MDVEVYGFNEFGQCSEIPSPTDQDYPLENNVRDVSFAWSYAVILTDDIFLVGFVVEKRKVFQKLIPPFEEKVMQVSACKRHVLVVTEDGECWQYLCSNGSWKKLPVFTSDEGEAQQQVAKVVCSDTLNVALSRNGQVFAIPSQMPTPGLRVTDIACGVEHCLLLTDVGRVYSWGTGTRGQLGHGDLESEERPREVSALAGLHVTRVAAGGWHSACVTADGDLYMFGWNDCGQLGFPSENTVGGKRARLEGKRPAAVTVQAVPTAVSWPGDQDRPVAEVSCGTRHTVALLEDGMVWGCGWNAYGQLVDVCGCQNCYDEMVKVNIPIGKKVQHVRCGAWNTALLFER